MATPFRIGMIGAGGISGAHTHAASKLGGRVVFPAVADPGESARVAFAEKHGSKAFASADALIDAAKGLELSAVLVCTPPSTRVGIVTRALAAGLHVLTEKPIASTVADAERLAEAARSRPGLRTAVAYCHRFTPSVLEMKRLIASGRIGRLTRWENVFACDLPGHKDKWFSDPHSAGGGAFIDMGSHSVDLLRFMVGEATLAGAVMDHAWPGRAETSATVLLRCPSPTLANAAPGVAAFIASGWAESSRFTVLCVGTGGTLSYDYEAPERLVFKDASGKAEELAVPDHGVRFADQLAAFADYASGGPSKGLATFEDGLAASRVVASAAQAAVRQ
ncbi:MAG: Gfo/Idh/MocA family oxidoreductase [Phycisphaeraceae bacterium]|nr:MAG: Gfo/Idh/MocA family oxidoreductase [Phycisphaeraceae bacterium]